MPKTSFEDLYFHYYSSLTYLLLDNCRHQQNKFAKAVYEKLIIRRRISSRQMIPECLFSATEDLMKEFLPIHEITSALFDLLSLKMKLLSNKMEFSQSVREALAELNKECVKFLGEDRISVRLFNEQMAMFVFQRETYDPNSKVPMEHHYVLSNYRTETTRADEYRWLTHPEEQSDCTHNGETYCSDCFAKRKKEENDNGCAISFNYCDYY